MTTDLVKRETLTALVGTYKKAAEEIEQGYKLLESAKNRLETAFIAGSSYRFNINGGGTALGVGAEAIQKTLLMIKREAWRCIVDRLEIRRILSISRREKLDQQLEDPGYYNKEKEPLPEVTEENILAMFQDGMAKASEYANEAVFEVFDWLRPRGGQNAALKTNQKWMLGNKAIRYCVEMKFTTGFQVRYQYDKNVTALDNVFHMLDGKGPLKTHNGPLYDAIANTTKDGLGETEYFKFKCCKNGNLHLEFKRPDIVAKINKIAGGRQIPGTN